MGGTYIECSECGKRALSVATRCPRCGHEFPPRAARERSQAVDFGRFLRPLVVVGVVVAGVALVTTVCWRSARGSAERDSLASAAVGMDTARAATSASARAAGSSSSSAGVRRFARTWTQVRSRRSVAGDPVAVLLPGDTVLVDSLRGGWWRVTLEGEMLGYVHQSTLATEPPRVAPTGR